jgi:hypothetical protein
LEANPQLSTLRGIADAFRVETWMLLVPNFPFSAIDHKPIKKITYEGYKLLAAFESLPDDKRKAILDFALFQMHESSQAKQIRETRLEYTSNQLKE